jgi:hypothetical protein
VTDNTLTNNDSGVVLANYTPDTNWVASATSPTHNQVYGNVIAKNDGITNHSPFTDENSNSYTGYQVGVADNGNAARPVDKLEGGVAAKRPREHRRPRADNSPRLRGVRSGRGRRCRYVDDGRYPPVTVAALTGLTFGLRT